MAAEWVIDASVAAKLYFEEEFSELARLRVAEADQLIAPDLFHLEIANIAVKRVRRGTASEPAASAAVVGASRIVDEFVAHGALTPHAYALARDHSFSAYDAAYLALADARGLKLLTADAKLAGLASLAGLGRLVDLLQEGGA